LLKYKDNVFSIMNIDGNCSGRQSIKTYFYKK
jgi:hypothetical protein